MAFETSMRSENQSQFAAKLFWVLFIGAGCMLTCCMPERFVRGVYVNGDGDTLRLRRDHVFKIEMANPDSAGKQQLKFTSGRWFKKGSKLHLTVAAKAMGDYWQCVPMKTGWRSLRRPQECSDDGNGMRFRKVHVKSPDKKERRKRRKAGEDTESG